MSVEASKESVIHKSLGCICVFVRQLHTELAAYFDFYNLEKSHHSLNYLTPAEEHFVL